MHCLTHSNLLSIYPSTPITTQPPHLQSTPTTHPPPFRRPGMNADMLASIRRDPGAVANEVGRYADR